MIVHASAVHMKGSATHAAESANIVAMVGEIFVPASSVASRSASSTPNTRRSSLRRRMCLYTTRAVMVLVRGDREGNEIKKAA